MDEIFIHRRFENIVQRFPLRIAVEDSVRRVNYDELNQYANRVAHALSGLGIGSQKVVGIYLEASVEYVIAILSVLKAGAIFMPVNTRFPPERFSAILEKTKPVTFLTNAALEDECCGKLMKFNHSVLPRYMLVFSEPGNFGIRDISGGASLPLHVPFSDNNPRLDERTDDSCYIVTTSASTGKPKAILGSQKGLSHFIRWEVDEFSLNEEVRVSLLAPITFDVSLRDIFVPLVTGGRLCIPDEETRHSPGKLLKWLKDKGITLLHIVPTLFRLLTQEIEDSASSPKELPSLLYALIAGEPLYGNDVIKWRRACGVRTELVNVYGPSETTLAKLFYRTRDKDFAPGEMIPIGKPIPDTEVLIVNDGKLCSVGETGEIYLKTPFMSKGYYNEPELTGKCFVKNQFQNGHTEIIYKTGDLGRYLPDKSVKFVGRLDGQIKLHGQRVEIEEIETALRQHPQVREAAVTARQDAFGNLRLVGYFVPKPGEKPEVESFRRVMERNLPDYMVPAVFVSLTALPLTHNGKIDRRALPEPEGIRPEMEQSYLPPSTVLEKDLSEIWCRVLGLDRVGIYDNFFALGGNSLLATQVISRVNKVLRVDLTLRSFFAKPTIAGLSEEIEKLKSEGEAFQIPAIRPISRASGHKKARP